MLRSIHTAPSSYRAGGLNEMACCVLGAFLIGQLLVLWRRIQPRLRFMWVTASLSLAAISIAYGLMHHSHYH